MAQIGAKIELACGFKGLSWQTKPDGSFDPQRLSGVLANHLRASGGANHTRLELTSTLLDASANDGLFHSYPAGESDICSH
jgi:hypothetical protein